MLPAAPIMVCAVRPFIAFVASTLLVTATAHARTMEAGQIVVSAGLGPSFRLGSDLAIPGAMTKLTTTAEFVLAPSWSMATGIDLGFSSTVTAKARFGGRYRFVGFEIPISPYVQIEALGGRLFDVLGANLTSVGARVGGGADYFLSARWLVGLAGGYELATTTGERPARYGTLDLFVTFSHVF